MLIVQHAAWFGQGKGVCRLAFRDGRARLARSCRH